MALVKRFEDLAAWREARALAAHCYRIARSSAFARDRELTSQLRRAAVSTVTNIAEGFRSGSKPEFRRFLRYAIRSATEVQGCLYVAVDQGYLTQAEFDTVYASAERLRALCSALVGRLSRVGADGGGRVAEAPACWSSGLRSDHRTSARQHVSTSAPDPAGT